MVFLAEMILGCLDIPWGYTETCGFEKFFNQPYSLLNSSVFLPVPNLTNQLGIFVIISRGKGAMFFSILFLLVLELFAWQILIMQEWRNIITNQEWPSSELITNFWYWSSGTIPRYIITSQYMEHVWWLKWWRRDIIKWLYCI